ncbi:MAG: hypothetical protein ALECFALPRED_004664 [Alectoria fallacina]|uniref:Uncharacterized protein n=1 Tax=Alectoria fallacina TaxID=1903189 RepID=A0A8H3EQR8_9LECA|nr:MAG: hypothetical protein ALECFALPRED_004664 [Alectoria fallacina]
MATRKYRQNQLKRALSALDPVNRSFSQIPEFQDYLRPAPASKMPVRGDIVPDQGIAPKPAPTNQDKVRPVVPPPTPLPLDFVKNDANAPTHAPKVQHPANAASILQPIAPTNIVADHTTGPKSNPDTHQQAHSKDAFQTTVRASNAPMGVKAPSPDIQSRRPGTLSTTAKVAETMKG